MAVIGHILLWVLYVLLGLLAFVLAAVLLVSLTPVKVCVHYGADGLRVRLGVLFYHRQLVPAPPPKPDKKKKRRRKKAASAVPGAPKASPKEKTVRTAHGTAQDVPKTRDGAPAASEQDNAAARLQDWLEQAAEEPAGETPPPKEIVLQEPTVLGKPAVAPKAAAEGPASDEMPSPKQAVLHEQPAPKKAVAPKKHKPPKKQAAKQAAKTDGPVDVQALLEHLPEAVGAAGRFVGAVLRSLRFQNLYVVIPVSGGLPDQVARRVGRTNAWFYALTARLQTCLRLRWRRVCIFPDYDGKKKDSLCLEAGVRGCALPVLIAALYLYCDLKKAKIL